MCNDPSNNSMRRSAFSLIELLVVIAIVATLASILVLILNPIEYIRRGRDAQRLKDYTLIHNAVNLYSYSAALRLGTADFDGPLHTNSCKNESDPLLYVSVPSDNGESDPSPPPSGWTYQRSSSTPLRIISGDGWLPINFSEVEEGLRPLNILPVDPVNTYDSGFYYTYTCGSYELNLRFESASYQQLAQLDGGSDPNVYEIGSSLTVAPEQEPYNPPAPPPPPPPPPPEETSTLVIYPNAVGYYNNWGVVGAASGWDAVNDPMGAASSTDYVRATSTGRIITFGLQDPSQSGSILKVRITVSASNNVTNIKGIAPRIRACNGLDDGNCSSHDASSATVNVSTYSFHSETWTKNPQTGLDWTWDDIKTLQAGAVSSGNFGSGELRMRQLYK